MKVFAAAAVVMLAGAAYGDFVEDFNGGGAFPWTVVDYAAPSAVLGWDYNYNIFDGADPRGNFSSGDGGAAHVDTDALGSAGAGPYNIGILSPETVLSPGAMLSYNINFQQIGSFDTAHVGISTDGGATFTQLMLYTADTGGFPTFPYSGDEPLGVVENIDLSAYGGQSAIIRFVYEGDGWNWFMQVDDVSVVPAPGTFALLGLGGLAIRRRR